MLTKNLLISSLLLVFEERNLFFFSERRNDLRGRQQFSPERPEVAVLGGRQAGPCAHCQPLQPQLPRQGLSRVGILNYQRKAILLQYARRLFHMSDWLPTLLSVARRRPRPQGAPPRERQASLDGADGVDQWESFDSDLGLRRRNEIHQEGSLRFA